MTLMMFFSFLRMRRSAVLLVGSAAMLVANDTWLLLAGHRWRDAGHRATEGNLGEASVVPIQAFDQDTLIAAALDAEHLQVTAQPVARPHVVVVVGTDLLRCVHADHLARYLREF